MKELLLIAGAIWLGNFLVGFCRAEALGVYLRDWLFWKRRNHLKVFLPTCSRCGEAHPNLKARPYAKAYGLLQDTYSHWAMCPIANEPILILVKDDAQH